MLQIRSDYDPGARKISNNWPQTGRKVGSAAHRTLANGLQLIIDWLAVQSLFIDGDPHFDYCSCFCCVFKRIFLRR